MITMPVNSFSRWIVDMRMRYRRIWVTQDSLDAGLRIDVRPATHRRIWSSRSEAKLPCSKIDLRRSLVYHLMRPDMTGGTTSLR